jgi:cell division septum initiation protein DivIVA
VDVQAKLAEIREAVETARSMPMSSSAVVNRAEILGMLDELQDTIGQALSESNKVVAEREGVVDEGRKEADLIIHEAKNERDRLVSDTEVFRLAQYQAERLVNDAKTEGEALRAETDEYVDTKLANFEISLERTLEAVRRGRDRLSGTTTMHGLTPEEADKIVLPDHLEG